MNLSCFNQFFDMNVIGNNECYHDQIYNLVYTCILHVYLMMSQDNSAHSRKGMMTQQSNVSYKQFSNLNFKLPMKGQLTESGSDA